MNEHIMSVRFIKLYRLPEHEVFYKYFSHLEFGDMNHDLLSKERMLVEIAREISMGVELIELRRAVVDLPSDVFIDLAR